MTTDEIIEEMLEEANGNRGSFYELYGSAISAVLEPLAEVFRIAEEHEPGSATQAAQIFYRGFDR